MSTLNVTTIIPDAGGSDVDLELSGKGTGRPNLQAGFKVGGVAGIGTASIQDDAIDGTKIADDSINSEHYVAASIDNEHLADDAVGVAELSATGTASSSTFLRGDNSWADPGGGPDQASQAEMEAESNVDKYIAPDLLKNGPSSCKAWGKFAVAGTVNASYNVSSVTDNSTGLWTVNWNTDFSSVNYAAVCGWRDDNDKVEFQVSGGSQATGTYEFKMVNGGGSLTDPNAADDMHVVAFGDH